MSKVDIRLLYQKDSGLGLERINIISGKSTCYGECDFCEEPVALTLEPDVLEYIEWLEEEFEKALSVGEQLLFEVHGNIFYNETSDQAPKAGN